jgi:hypothetical protein
MNSQYADRSDAADQDPSDQAAAGAGPAGRQAPGEADGHGDAHATAQAARSVMHPERHDPEWRYYHGAVPG